MKFTGDMKDEFIVFYLQFINSLEGLEMFFSSAFLIRRLRKYTATLPLFKRGHSLVNVFCLFPLGSARRMFHIESAIVAR